jgi:hypothetical protein
VEWFKKGDMESIKKYCIQDVTATRDLFYYGLINGHIYYRDKKDDRKAKVDVTGSQVKGVRSKV